MKLSILIPTTPDREEFFKSISRQVRSQAHGFCTSEYLPYGNDSSVQIHRHSNAESELITFCDSKKYSIGHKRNELLRLANGEYSAFIDDDDRISDNYFKLLFEGIEKGVDCCSLKGVITEDGKRPFIFEHSLKYKEYKTNEEVVMDLDMIGWNQHNKVKYERYPNHLNCIKSSIAKQFKFPEKNHGEDTDWATQIFKAGVLKSEHYINEFLYYYDYISKK